METTQDKTRHDGQTTNSPRATSAATLGAADSIDQQVKHDAQQAKQAAKDKASEMSTQAQDAAKEQAAAGADRAANEADKISSAVEAAAQALEDEDREGMASYVRELGEGMSTFAERLQDRNVEQLTDDARTLARDNPTAFLLGSVAVGFGLSRFFKASAERDGSQSNGATQASSATASSSGHAGAPSLYTGSTPAGAGSTTPATAGSNPSSTTRLGESV